MRVLNVIGGISTNAGAQTAIRLERYFSGYDLTCGIFESSNPSFDQIADKRGIDTVFFGPSATSRVESISLLPGAGYPKAALHAVRNYSTYDLVHVYGGPLFHGPVGVIIAATSRCPLITRFNGYVPLPDGDPKRTLVRTIIRSLLRSSGVVFNSQAQKDDILNTYDVEDSENLRVIPPGVEQQWFKPVAETDDIANAVGIDTNSTVIGSVLTPRPVKRLDKAFDVVATLAQYNDVTYVVLGDSDNLDEYKQLAVEKGVDDHVYWGGHVDQSELAAWYSLFDVTILTSEWESFGMSLTESYLCETPCVAFDVGGMSDQIVDTKTGFLIEPYDTDEFATAVENLMTNDTLKSEFGARGKEYVAQRFTLKSVTSQYRDLITTVTGRNDW